MPEPTLIILIHSTQIYGAFWGPFWCNKNGGSPTFPQGFQKSKKFGHSTLGNGGKKTFNR